jgi:hypothetical protein
MGICAQRRLCTFCDPTRRTIFERLASGGEQNVRALTEFAGALKSCRKAHSWGAADDRFSDKIMREKRGA